MRRAEIWLALVLIPGILSAAASESDTADGAEVTQEQSEAPPRELVDPGTIAQRALEIEAREAALRELETSVRAQIDELQKLQQQALLVLEPERQEREEEVKKLVAFYQNMKPKGAAELLEKLPLPLATQVLSRMKTREAGKILNVMNAARAVQISKRMAGNQP